ncbi:MAG: hypothetical protein Kow0069_04990 [Promethearchaeota archaeon]
MKKTTISITIVALLALSSYMYFTNAALVGAATPNLTAVRVDEATLTLDGQATESFWDQATFQEFSLTAVQGAATSSVDTLWVRAVVTPTQIRLHAIWRDVTKNNNKSVSPEDRFVIMILNDDSSDAMAAPCMKTGTNGAATSGIADQWHWKAARTDSDGADHAVVERKGVIYNTGDTAATKHGLNIPAHSAVFRYTNYTGNYDIRYLGGSAGDVVYYNSTGGLVTSSAPGATKLVLASHPHSFADNEFLNETARYRSGDSEYTKFGVDPSPLSQYWRYDVFAKGYHNGTHWSLEIARALAINGSTTTIDHEFKPGETVKVAFALYDGEVGHDENVKYITSAWKTLYLEGGAAGGAAIDGYSFIAMGLAVLLVIVPVVARKRRV